MNAVSGKEAKAVKKAENMECVKDRLVYNSLHSKKRNFLSAFAK
jgi:hypothetical protein